MNGIEERITEVLRKHREELHEEGICICGWHAHAETDYPSHVAVEVVAALRLTQEWVELEHEQQLFPDEIFNDLGSAEERAAERCQSCDRCRNAFPKVVVSRWVSGWERDQ